MIKKISIIFLILLCVIVPVYGASTPFYLYDDNYSQDPTYIIRTWYDNRSNYFLKLFQNTKDNQYYSEILNYIYNVRQFMYIDNVNNSTWRIYYVNGQTSDTINTHITFDGGYTSVPTEEYVHNCNFYYTIGWRQSDGYYIEKTYGNPYITCYVPLCLDLYTNQNVFDYSKAYFEGDTSTMIAILNKIDEDINTTNDKLEDVKEGLNKIDETLKDDDDSDINYKVDTPTVSSGDSEGAFDNIFSRFVNSLTSDYDNTIAFPIPFTRQHIFIDSSFTYDVLSKIGNTTNIGNLIISMLSSVWYFLVGMYILHDIQKIKDDIKTGAIMNKTDTNIKTEML